MAILINDTTPRIQYTATSGQTVFTVPFEFFENADLKVYKNSTLLTITTNYTVTGAGVTGGGSVTLTSGATAGDVITIFRDIAVKRVTDFPTSGPFNISALNNDLDRIVAMVQEREDEVTRVIQLPDTDPAVNLQMPAAASRASRVLGFDATGNVISMQELGNYRGNWASGTAYVLRDLIKDTTNANIYICVAAHTSSGSLPITTNANAAAWALLVDAATATSSSSAAASSASAAASSASAAAGSASAASTSASNAATSASNAATSATNASNSASTASTQATNAANSASSASTSATNAANSATSASGSASTATTQASNASSSATSAASSASTATTQASNAASSASAASTSASNAATSASNAATSASNASSSATAAAAARSAAETARDQTLTAFDNFDDRYLGTKTGDPTLDNDGNALVAGALYFNSTSGVMKVYTGSAWVAAYVSGSGFLATSGGTITGNLVVDANSAADAVRITQTGAGNALVVEDIANPDSTPFVVNAEGRLIVGSTQTQPSLGATNTPSIGVFGNSSSNNGFANYAYLASTGGSFFNFAKSRSTTPGTFSIVTSADDLGYIKFIGDDGTQFVEAARIWSEVDGTPAVNDMPGRLVFSTTPAGSSTPVERMRIGSTGSIGIGTAGTEPFTIRNLRAFSGATSAYGISQGGEIQSAVTANAYVNHTAPTTQATAFTLSNVYHYVAASLSLGAGSSVTSQYGFSAGSGLTTATNNYGFHSNIASGTGRWNFYAAGTADNYFAGQVQLGAGTAAAPALSTTGDTNTGIFFPAADTVAISAAGTEDFRIGPAGQIGIQGANYGTSGQVLTSNGSAAAPSWNTVSASKAAETQTFNSSGTWTKPSGYGSSARAFIQLWGGGGSGGKQTVSAGGGGGGGGGYSELWVLLSSLGSTVSVTIGAGGAAITGTSNGNNGGTSSFGSLVSAYGGAGGLSGRVGGGGGGQFSAGSGQNGGRIGGGFASGAGTAGDGEGWGGGAGAGGDACTSNGYPGGYALYGGAGGGGGGFSSAGAGGLSINGGNGGPGGTSGSGTAGSAPGGGGGGTRTGASTGAGAAGRVVITVFDGL